MRQAIDPADHGTVRTAGGAAPVVPATPAAAAADAAPAPMAVQVLWGAGSAAPSLALQLTTILLLPFMTDQLAIPAALAAALVGFSKIYDAVTDPLMGVISDRTRSPWGRRRPYLLVGGALLALSIVLLFDVPEFESPAAAAWYMGFALLFFATAYTIFTVPYLAMPPSLAPGYHERSRLMMWRVYAVSVGILVASVLGPKLVAGAGGGLDGHATMAWTLAPLALAAGVAAFLGTRGVRDVAPARGAPRPPFREQVRSAVANRPFFVLLVVKLLMLMVLGLGSAYPYFFLRVLGLEFGLLGVYFGAMTLAMLVAQPVWYLVARRLGKRTTFQVALLVTTGVSLSWWFAAPGEPLAGLIVRAVLMGLGAGGSMLMGQALLPDTMEYDRRLTGLRREGLFAGLYTTMEKLSAAAGIFVVGAFLGAMGYVEARAGQVVEQPESALLGIRIAVAAFPALVSFASFLCLYAYDLSEAKLHAARREPAAGEGADRAADDR